MLYLRTHAVEYGSIPLTALLPKLDKPAAILKVFQTLIKDAVPFGSDKGQLFVEVSAVSAALGLAPTLTRALVDLVAAVSPFQVTDKAEASSESTDPLSAFDRVDLSALCLFLMMQLYERQAIKEEDSTNKQMEVWPTEQAVKKDYNLMSPRSPMASPRTRPAMTLALPSLLSRANSDGGGEGGWSGFSSPSSSSVFPQGLNLASTSSLSLAGSSPHGPAVHQFFFGGLVDYINRNGAVLVDLVRDSAESKDTITAKEFNRLSYLFIGSDGTVTPTRAEQPPAPLSSFIPEFEKGSGAALVKDLLDHFLTALQLLHCAQPNATALGQPLGAPMAAQGPSLAASLLKLPGGGGPGMPPTEISGVSKSTVVRGEDAFPSGSVRVTDCRDTTLYLLAPMQYCNVQSCTDCTIVVGAVGRCLRIERCERLQLIAAATRLVVHSCHDCTLYTGVNRPIYIVGDCRFLQLAPYCSKYEQLGAHMRAAGVEARPNLWSQHVHLMRELRVSAPDSPKGGGGRQGMAPATLLPADRMMPFVIPFKGGPGKAAGGAPSLARSHDELGPELGLSASGQDKDRDVEDGFHLPPEYAAALDSKMRMVAELRTAVRTADLPEGKKVELQAVVQAYFKEWLQVSGQMRQIQDIARVEKEA